MGQVPGRRQVTGIESDVLAAVSKMFEIVGWSGGHPTGQPGGWGMPEVTVVLPPNGCCHKHNQSKMDAERGRKRKFVLSIAAAVGVLIGDDDLDLTLKPKHTQRFWQRSWLKDRDDEAQMNTTMKLQEQLLKVNIPCKQKKWRRQRYKCRLLALEWRLPGSPISSSPPSAERKLVFLRLV